MPEKQRAWQTLCEPKYGKPVKIVVWKNKEFSSPGQEITLHPKFMRSWNAALGFLTLVLQPRFGAVRKLYHLETKKLVLCLQEIQQGDKYVAVGGEKVSFRKNGYLAGFSKMLQQSPKSPESSQLSSSNADLNFMVCTKKKKRTVLYFMVSGRACQIPIKVVLIERDLLDYSMILEYLGHRLDVGEGIQHLCDTHGKPIQDPAELQHGQLYVAVPHASSFLQLDYLELFAKLLPPKTFKAAKPKRTKRVRVVNVKTDPVASQEEENFAPASKDDFEGVNEDNGVGQEEECPADAAKASKLENNSEDDVEQLSIKSDKHVELQIEAKGGWEQCKSSSGNAVLQAKCVGEKCVDQECRLLRKEFTSLPASFYNIEGDLEDIEADTKWADYAAGIQETVEGIVSDVSTVKGLLEDIVEESFVQLKHRGIATPAFIKSDSLPVLEEEDETEDANFCHILPPSDTADESIDESVTTVELEHNFQDAHLTTFADIARNRELEEGAEPLFAFDRAAFPDHMHPDYGRMSTVSRKGVSFMRVTSPDEDVKPLLHENLRPPSFSILKTKDEPLKDDGTFCLVPHKNSFLGARRDSVENTRDRLVSSEALDTNSKSIQKDFAREDKGVQVPEVKESANITELAQEHAALSDIYHNFEREGASVWALVVKQSAKSIEFLLGPRTSLSNILVNQTVQKAWGMEGEEEKEVQVLIKQSTDTQSLQTEERSPCHRELSPSFACSEIYLSQWTEED